MKTVMTCVPLLCTLEQAETNYCYWTPNCRYCRISELIDVTQTTAETKWY